MPIININIEINETNAKITKTIQGLEMLYGRVVGETDLEYVKRICVELFREAYKRKRDADNVAASLLLDTSTINPV